MACNDTEYPGLNPGNCGNIEPDCGCGDTQESPEFTCPDPEKCDEIYPAECVIYTGPDIKCTTAQDLHPLLADLYYLVLQNGTRDERRLTHILQQINGQLCYIFSKEFIMQLLTIIQGDEELRNLFCEIVCSCECLPVPPPPVCNLVCAGITSVELIPTGTPVLRVKHPAVTNADTYNYTVYLRSGSTNVFNSVYSYTRTIPSSGVINQDLTVPNLDSQKDYIVTYQAVDTDISSCFTGLAPAETFNYTGSLPCGAYMLAGVIPAPQTCDLRCLTETEFVANYTTDSNGNKTGITMTVKPLTSTLGSVRTTVHWYEKAANNLYAYRGSDIKNGQSTQYTVPLTGLTTGLPYTVVAFVKVEVPGSSVACTFGASLPSNDYMDSSVVDSTTCGKFTYTPACRTAKSISALWLANGKQLQLNWEYSLGSTSGGKIEYTTNNGATWNTLINNPATQGTVTYPTSSGVSFTPQLNTSYWFRMISYCDSGPASSITSDIYTYWECPTVNFETSRDGSGNGTYNVYPFGYTAYASNIATMSCRILKAGLQVGTTQTLTAPVPNNFQFPTTNLTSGSYTAEITMTTASGQPKVCTYNFTLG